MRKTMPKSGKGTTTMTVDHSKRYWHFLNADCRLVYGSRDMVEAGKTYRAIGPLALCNNGMHASERAIDALFYAPGPVVCRVALGGEILVGADKVCARTRTVLWMADASTVLHEFATWAADWILDRLEAKGFPIDPRSRAAPEAKRRWLRGEITDAELDAAGAAAWDAARAAAWNAAGAAARNAAWDAAWGAARAAARDAASAAARAAARAAAGDILNAELTRRLLALAPGDSAE